MSAIAAALAVVAASAAVTASACTAATTRKLLIELDERDRETQR